jgi:hypothetical protein
MVRLRGQSGVVGLWFASHRDLGFGSSKSLSAGFKIILIGSWRPPLRSTRCRLVTEPSRPTRITAEVVVGETLDLSEKLKR